MERVVLVVVLAGCGSLLGEEGLRRVDGLEIPQHLAWELRWATDEGLVSPCSLISLAPDEVDLTLLPLDQIDLRLPDPLDVPSMVGGVAVAVPLAVTRADADTLVRTASSASPLDRVWGTTPFAWIDDGSGGEWRVLVDPDALAFDPGLAVADEVAWSDWTPVTPLAAADPLLRPLLDETAFEPCE